MLGPCSAKRAGRSVCPPHARGHVGGLRGPGSVSPQGPALALDALGLSEPPGAGGCAECVVLKGADVAVWAYHSQPQLRGRGSGERPLRLQVTCCRPDPAGPGLTSARCSDCPAGPGSGSAPGPGPAAPGCSPGRSAPRPAPAACPPVGRARRPSPQAAGPWTWPLAVGSVAPGPAGECEGDDNKVGTRWPPPVPQTLC